MHPTNFQSAFDHLGVGIAQIGLKGEWLMANRHLCDLMGFSNGQLPRVFFDEFFPTVESSQEKLARSLLVKGEIGNYSAERRATLKNGGAFPVRMVFSLVRDPVTNDPESYFVVIEDLAALRSSDTALQEAETARRDLARQLTTSQEDERTRIARELHDDIGQSLSVLRIQMLRAGLPISGLAGKIHPTVAELSEEVRLVAERVSTLSHQLHAPTLQYLGLAAAVRSHCREFSENYKIPVEVNCEDISDHLDNLLALSLLRIVQEALHNAGKYSEAKSIRVVIQGSPTELSLLIADDGVGFDLEEARLAAGLGLISMRERIHLARGQFAISSKPGEGTRISARVPLSQGTPSVASSTHS